MKSTTELPARSNGSANVLPAEETRRALLTKAALIGGGLGLGALTHPPRADAGGPAGSLDTDFTGYNSVKDWGAVGNGTNDDRNAIQSCIDASAPGGSNPGVVYFPPGTYAIGGSVSLLLPSGSILRGVGPQSKIVAKLDSIGNTTQLILNKNPTTTGNDDIVIEDLELDGGNGAGRFGEAPNVTITAPDGALCERIRIRRVVCHDATGIGIQFVNSTHVEVSQCHIHHNDRDGVDFFYNCSDIRIEGNHIHDTLDDCIGLNAESPTTSGHTLTRVSIIGNILGPAPGSTGTLASNLLRIGGAQIVAVTGNVFLEGAQAAIQAHNGGVATPAQDIVIEGNVISHGGQWVPSAAGDAIQVMGGLNGAAVGCDRVLIKGNDIETPRRYGVLVSNQAGGTMTDITIIGNMIRYDTSLSYVNSTGRGIACIAGSNPLRGLIIEGNIVDASPYQGLYVYGSNLSRVNVHDNQVFNSGKKTGGPGIWVENASDVSVIGNRSTDTLSSGKTQTYGLRLISPGGNTLVIANDFTGNATGGILRVSVSSPTYIFENLGDDAPIARHLSATASWSPSVLPANPASTTVTVPGASLGDTVAVGFNVQAGVLISGDVTSTNVVTVTLFNATTGTVNPSGTLRVDVWKH